MKKLSKIRDLFGWVDHRAGGPLSESTTKEGGGSLVRSAVEPATSVPPEVKKSQVEKDILSLNSILESDYYPLSKYEPQVLTKEIRDRHANLSQSNFSPEPLIYPTALEVLKQDESYKTLKTKIQSLVYKYTLNTIKVRKGYTFADGTVLSRGDPIALLDPECIKELPLPPEKQDLLHSCLSHGTILCYAKENVFTIEKQYLKL